MRPPAYRRAPPTAHPDPRQPGRRHRPPKATWRRPRRCRNRLPDHTERLQRAPQPPSRWAPRRRLKPTAARPQHRTPRRLLGRHPEFQQPQTSSRAQDNSLFLPPAHSGSPDARHCSTPDPRHCRLRVQIGARARHLTHQLNRPRAPPKSGLGGVRRPCSLRLQRHQVLFGGVLSPRIPVGGSLALGSFSVPDGVCLETRHLGAIVLPVSGIRNRGRSKKLDGSASLLLVFVVGVAEALACGLLVRFFSERGPCDRLSKCRSPCGQEQLWFVRTATGPDGYRCLKNLPFSSPFFP